MICKSGMIPLRLVSDALDKILGAVIMGSLALWRFEGGGRDC